MTARFDEGMFEALVTRERDGLFRYLEWTLRDREDALDALQETLLRAFRGFGELRDPSRARSWLYVIAANVARRSASKRGRAPRTLGVAPSEEAVPLGVTGDAPAPGAALDSEETRRDLERALAELAPELREPLLLFAASGLKYREIAEALGWPLGTVTTRIHAARRAVAARLRRGS